MNGHQAAGGVVLLLTRTFRHHAHQSLQSNLSKLKLAEEKYKAGEPWRRLASRFGIAHMVRSKEVTYTPNGWHPHLHELIFLKGEVDTAALKEALFVRWKSATTRAGLDALIEGFDLQDGSHAAKYAAKWGLESELTKSHVKKGKEGSVSPWDLLRVALLEDDAETVDKARSLFREYAQAFKGQRQLVYSKGLRELYQVEVVEDEELVKGEEPDAQLLGMLTPAMWRGVLRSGLRGKLLEVLNENKGDWSCADEVIGEALAYKGPPRHKSVI